jgi:hypothetical protein
VVWGTKGSGQAAADEFCDELGAQRSGQIEAISMDMGPGYAKSALRFKDAPWALLKNPENLTATQAATHRGLRRAGGEIRRPTPSKKPCGRSSRTACLSTTWRS